MQLSKKKCSIALAKRFVRVADDLRRIKKKLRSKNELLNTFQFGLDVLGLIPALGEVADMINAAIYGIRKMWKDMLLSLVAIAPGIGQAVGFLKVFKKTGGLDIVLNVIDHVLSNGIIMDAMKDLVNILKKGLKSSLMEVKNHCY